MIRIPSLAIISHELEIELQLELVGLGGWGELGSESGGCIKEQRIENRE